MTVSDVIHFRTLRTLRTADGKPYREQRCPDCAFRFMAADEELIWTVESLHRFWGHETKRKPVQNELRARYERGYRDQARRTA